MKTTRETLSFLACAVPAILLSGCTGMFGKHLVPVTASSTAAQWTMKSSVLSQQAIAILQTNCYSCHAATGSGGVSNITNPTTLLSTKLVLPGDPADSPLILSITQRGMPQGTTLSAADLTTLKSWIQTEFVLSTTAAAPAAPAGRFTYACDPTQVSTSAIHLISNRQYMATLAQITGEISPNIINDSQIQANFGQLPSDITAGVESTIVLDSTHVTLYNANALRIGSLISTNSAYLSALPGTNGCLTTTPNAACATNFVNGFGLIAFRRPLTSVETNSFLALYGDASATVLADRVMLVIAAFLQSPDFLYEIYDGGSQVTLATLNLNPYEYAAKLSLFYMGSSPDPTLRALAANGTILNQTVASAQIDRMMQTPAGQAMIVRYFKGWLSYNQFDSFTYPTAVANGLNTSTLQVDTVAEVDNFVSDIVLQKKTYSDLMLSTQTRFSSPSLAALYGIPDPAGAQTSLISSQRAGLLTRAAFLNKRSGTTTTPIVRGKFILKQLVCGTIGAPPPTAPAVLAPLPAGVLLSTRDKTFAQTQQAGSTCILCHDRVNNLGFPFEIYDNLGRYRTTERMFDSVGNYLNVNLPLNTLGVTNELANTTITVTDALDLSNQLSNNDRAMACMSQNWEQFQLGRAPAAADNCAMNVTLNTLYGSGTTQGTIYDMMKNSTLSDVSGFKQWNH